MARGGHGVGVVDQVHDDGTSAVGARVLGEVVGARELLTALGALEGLVVRVERPVVAFEVLLAPEPAVAQLADEGLGRVVSKRLLAAAAVGGCGNGSGADVLGVGRALVVLVLGGTLLLRRGLLLGAARGGLGGSGSHHDRYAGVAVGALDSLVLVLVAVLARLGRAGEAAGVEGVGVPEIVVAGEARVAKGDGVGAGARPAGLGRGGLVLTAEVDKAVYEVVL